MQSHDYIYTPAGDFWPAARVNARLPPVKLFDKSGNPIIDQKTGDQKKMIGEQMASQICARRADDLGAGTAAARPGQTDR